MVLQRRKSGVQIVYLNRLELYQKSPNCGERQYKLWTWKRRFDATLGAGGRARNLSTGGAAGARRARPLEKMILLFLVLLLFERAILLCRVLRRLRSPPPRPPVSKNTIQ